MVTTSFSIGLNPGMVSQRPKDIDFFGAYCRTTEEPA